MSGSLLISLTVWLHSMCQQHTELNRQSVKFSSAAVYFIVQCTKPLQLLEHVFTGLVLVMALSQQHESTLSHVTNASLVFETHPHWWHHQHTFKSCMAQLLFTVTFLRAIAAARCQQRHDVNGLFVCLGRSCYHYIS